MISDSTVGYNVGENFELRLQFKAVFPGLLHLEVSADVEHKMRLLSGGSMHKVGKGQIDLIVTENKNPNRKQKNKNTEDQIFLIKIIALIILIGIIASIIIGTIIIQFMKYK